MAEVASAAPPVEARSLSSVTSIAANPPAYPRNPTQAPLDRLVLYIVKVPGSQDVVLTPLKPPTKSNVSNEAINSSFYYLHVASEADEHILRTIESEYEQNQQQRQEASQQDGPSSSRLPIETLSRLNDFHRKPVGGGGSGGAATEPIPPPPPPHREIPLSPTIPRKPAGLSEAVMPASYTQGEEDRGNQVPGSHGGRSSLDRNEYPKLFTIPRRPLTSSDGSAPSATGVSLSTPAPPQADYYPYSHGRLRPSIENDRPRLSSDTEEAYLAQEGRPSNITEKLPSPVAAGLKPPPSFQITVIRRDPASGHQWNVGTISGSNLNKAPIHVEISNPGYGKFLNNEAFSLGQSLPAASKDGNAAAEVIKTIAHKTPNNDTNRVFRRDVVPIRHGHHHNMSKTEIFHRRTGSADSKIADIVNSKVGRGYYSFTSPWNGTCSFVASVNGRSIKCKHTIPGPSTNEHHNNAEVTVSELRFNIPFPLEQSFRSPLVSVLAGEKGSKRGALAQVITSNIQKVQQRARSRSGSESNPSNRPPSASSSEDLAAADEDRLDLSLAREHGGGGMSGKSAKLGKLIIEDEGIKMIDLVVAASMGVWWRSCNRPHSM